MNAIQNICIGFSEGLVVPLIEIVISIMITVLLTVQQVAQTLPHQGNLESTINLPLMLGLFAIMNIVEALVIGLKDSLYAVSYCFGALLGLYLFSSIILNMYPQATAATYGVIGIVIFGIILKIFIVSKKNQARRNDFYYQ